MTFQDEQKQAEYNAFAAWYAEVAKRPSTSAVKSLMNQLRDIGTRLYGNGPFQEVLRANKRAALTPETPERKLGKQSGGRSDRHSPSPVARPPKPGSDRAKRLAERMPQNDRLEAAKVVAEGDLLGFAGKDASIKMKVVKSKENPNDGHFEEWNEKKELANVQLSTGATLNTETGRTESNLVADARELSAKDLVEKYGRDLIAEYLFGAGFELESLSEKTDRQIANALKKHVTE